MTVKTEDLNLVRKRLADFIESAEVISPSSAYDKLVHVADVEDRSIGRQLSRLVDQAYENVRPMQPFPETKNRYGIESVLED